MNFWDTSAVIPLLLREKQSVRVREWHARDSKMAVWYFTVTECHSAIERKQREGRLGMFEVAELKDRLHEMQSQWAEIRPSTELRDRAHRVLAVHPLSAADALQLAAALVIFGEKPAGHHFLTFDSTLALAARREGFIVSL